jgi:hypothetical protein
MTVDLEHAATAVFAFLERDTGPFWPKLFEEA